MSDAGFDEVVHEFVAEAGEILARLESGLVALERSPEDAELLAGIFRGFHTLKGNSGFLGFARIQETAHAAEALLSLFRDRRARPDAAATSALLEAVDRVRALVAPVASGGAEAAIDVTPLTRRLAELAGAPAAAAEAADAPSEKAEPPAPADGTVRVDVDLLDRLMNWVGELVLARNQLLQQVSTSGDGPGQRAAHQVSTITSRLQEGIMKARLRPVGQLLQRFRRVVRDLAVACGKKARLEVSGEGTELDRAILEAISEPLTHLLRNAVDHGLEPEEERLRRGKPAEGRIRISARQESGHVVIDVEDDGAGVDVPKVRERALRLGRIDAERAAGMSAAETLNLIFERGLSTSDAVTRVSGRGVGMDVVKTQVERVGGTLELRNAPGHGLTLRIRIPLTLAILPALIVSARGGRFALPQGSLVELIRPGEGAGVERIHDAPVYRLRDRLLPLLDLGALLGLAGESSAASTIVVLKAGEEPFGLLVDGVHDTEEVVVKSLSPRLRELDLYAGAAILGDARIALILDVAGLARRARLKTEGGAAASAPRSVPAVPASRPLLLLKGGDDGRMAIDLAGVERLEVFPPEAIERVGGREVAQYRGGILPLVRVAEALPERRARRRAGPAGEPGPVPVVVHRQGDALVGLVVEGILDILDEPAGAERPSSRPGVLRCVVARGRVTELLDVGRLMEAGS